MIKCQNKNNLRLSLLAVFLFQLVFLPGRYYTKLDCYFWPLPYNIILLLSGLFILCLSQAMKVSINEKRTPQNHPMMSVTICILFFLIVQMSSSLVNLPSARRAMVDIGIYYITFYGPIIVCFLTYYSIHNFDDIFKLIKIFLLIVLTAIIISILFVISTNLFGFVPIPSGQRLFLYRLFIPRLGTTGLSQLISVALPLIFSLYLLNKKYIYNLFFIAASIALLLTFGRWSIIVSMFSMSLYLFLIRSKISKKARKIFIKRIVISVSILGILVLILFSSKTWMVNFLVGRSDAVVDRTNSFVLREKSFKEALSFFSNRPLWGYGPGEIYVRLHSYAKYPDSEAISPYDIVQDMPHSTFAMILAEGGMVSFASFILLLVVMLKMQFNSINLSKDYKIIGIGLFISSFAFIFTMLFSNFDNRLPSAILFWFVQGMALGFNKISRCSVRV